jgi:hypothetical protein
MPEKPAYRKMNLELTAFARFREEQEQFARQIQAALRPHGALLQQIADQDLLFKRLTSAVNGPFDQIAKAAEFFRKQNEEIANIGKSFASLSQFAETQAAIAKALRPLHHFSEAIALIERYHVPCLELYAPDTSSLMAHIARGSSFEGATYRGFFRMKQAEALVVNSVTEVPVPVATLPSRETFLAAESAKISQSTLRQCYGSPIKAPEKGDDVIVSMDQFLGEELSCLDRELLKMLAGARAAIVSKNPDRLRQVSTSLREFLKGVIMQLAPEEIFLAWAQAEQITEKNAKKLETKIQFITRNAKVPQELSFYQIDAGALRLLLNHFNEGVHRNTARFDEKHLPALIRRVEGFVATLIELDRAYNRS